MNTTDAFRQLHQEGLFVMPNPWDVGSAKYLEWRGFPALATTSSGFAATLGRLDQQVGRDELLDHVQSMTAALTIPLSVDAERCFADTADGVVETVRLLAEAGAAGLSIEDYNPTTATIEPLAVATERVAAAAEEAGRHGLVLTARTENHLYGVDDLDDTVARLVAYRDAGAEVVFAPGLLTASGIGRIVDEVGVAVNVLPSPSGPSTGELANAGVRRVSTGGALAWAAYGALGRAADELLTAGTSTYGNDALAASDRDEVFGS